LAWYTGKGERPFFVRHPSLEKGGGGVGVGQRKKKGKWKRAEKKRQKGVGCHTGSHGALRGRGRPSGEKVNSRSREAITKEAGSGIWVQKVQECPEKGKEEKEKIPPKQNRLNKMNQNDWEMGRRNLREISLGDGEVGVKSFLKVTGGMSERQIWFLKRIGQRSSGIRLNQVGSLPCWGLTRKAGTMKLETTWLEISKGLARGA